MQPVSDSASRVEFGDCFADNQVWDSAKQVVCFAVPGGEPNAGLVIQCQIWHSLQCQGIYAAYFFRGRLRFCC